MLVNVDGSIKGKGKVDGEGGTLGLLLRILGRAELWGGRARGVVVTIDGRGRNEGADW